MRIIYYYTVHSFDTCFFLNYLLFLFSYDTFVYDTNLYHTQMYRMESPFQYGTVVSGKFFINRKEEKARLKQNLLSGINTMLISPRRWGKSSLVKDSMLELTKENNNVRVCYLDLFAVGTEHEFYEVLAREVVQSVSGKLDHWVDALKKHLSAITPKITLGADPSTQFSISIPLSDIEKAPLEVLDLAEKLALEKDIRLIVCIDEFQNIAELDNYETFEKRLRSVWQNHQQVSYCLYGSKRHMMNDIFNNPSKPFYRFGDLMELQKIDKEEWVKYIVRGFKSTGKYIECKQARRIAELMDNHSWYVQQLAHYAWTNTESTLSDEDLERAVNQLINTSSPFFIKEFESLSKTQVNLLKAVLMGESQLSSQRVMNEYGLGSNRNATRNKQTLEQADIIESIDQGYKFLDPVFALWFKKKVIRY